MTKSNYFKYLQSKETLLFFLFFLVIISIPACKKKQQFSSIPAIDFVRFTKDTVNQGDSLLMTIHFQDGEGDFGYGYTSTASCDLCRTDTSTSCLFHPTWSLFLLDKRDSCLEFFKMPYIDNRGSVKDLEGTIDIEKYNMCCKKIGAFACTPLGSNVYDTAFYYVILKDRAGHFSNSLALPPLYVRCQ
jgi:hypothetical protein